MYNFDPYNVLLAIATNIPVLLMTAFMLQGHIFPPFLKHNAKLWHFIYWRTSLGSAATRQNKSLLILSLKIMKIHKVNISISFLSLL